MAARTKAGNGSKSSGTKQHQHQPETRQCVVQLTEAERLERGEDMAVCEVQIERLKAERAEFARGIRKQEQRRNELGHALETGTEERELVCTWVPDYSKNVLRLTRPDTGEVIDTRAMTVDDRMVDMFAGDATPANAPPPRSPRSRRTKQSTEPSVA